jgi:prepilin-type N-terminal cleavage/methylation domain-containing protein
MSRATRRNLLAGGPARCSFTLIELLIVSAIIAILSSTALFALNGVMEDAKAVRTRAQIAKIHQIIMERWETYRSRKVPLVIPPGADLRQRSLARLQVMRELMRMEMPDRITDLSYSSTTNPVTFTTIPAPALWRTHRRRADRPFLPDGTPVAPAARFLRTVPANVPEAPLYSTNYSALSVQLGAWTIEWQTAECLYLILASVRDGEDTALDFFKQSEIGDVDGDGRFEILDGWGRPIKFLRWAPGFATVPGPDQGWGFAGQDDNNDGTVDNRPEIGAPLSDDGSELQSRNAREAPDHMDPLLVDLRFTDGIDGNDPFALIPLIFSAGPDGLHGVTDEPVNSPNPFAYALTPTFGPNDPYFDPNMGSQIGNAANSATEDNISNHLVEAN